MSNENKSYDARLKQRRVYKGNFENWGGYLKAKIEKLQDQYETDAGNSNRKGIFEGISIFVSGFTVPSAEELKRIMVTHGGTYHHYYCKAKTSHIIASSLPKAKNSPLNKDVMVTSNWITESVTAGYLLDYKKYLLFSSISNSQPKLGFATMVDSVKRSYSPDECLEGQISTNLEVDDSIPLPCNTSNPKFLTEFYQNSRFHHISVAGAMFKRYVRDLQNKEYNFSGISNLEQWLQNQNKSPSVENYGRIIMHIDMDCFFVSVGLLNYPELGDKPMAVTHSKKNSLERGHQDSYIKASTSKNTSQYDNNMSHSKRNPSVNETSSLAEIASCSYEARRRGIRNGMFVGAALKLCPDLRTIPYNFEGYKKVSKKLYDIVASYTKDIEAVSCDEMFVDLTKLLKKCHVSPLDFTTCLREQIKKETHCPCSCGLGPNMLIARLATRKAKPDGQFMVTPSEVDSFIQAIDISELPGVGRTLKERLQSKGIVTCLQVQNFSLHHLQNEFGSHTGKMLFDFSKGIDERTIDPQRKRKSVSAEVNYGIRFKHWQDVQTFLLELSGEVSSRLKDAGVGGRTITLKVKVRAGDAPVEAVKYMGHGVCENIAKATTIPFFTTDKDIIFRESVKLLKKMLLPCKDLRGVGIQVTKLSDLATGAPSSSLSTIDQFLKEREVAPGTSERTSVTKPGVKKELFIPSSSLVECKDEELPSSFSEIDKSFLSALPFDIKESIRQEFDQRKVTRKRGHQKIEKKRQNQTSLKFSIVKSARTSSSSKGSSIEADVINETEKSAHLQSLCSAAKLSLARNMIGQCIESRSIPDEADMEVLTNYCKKLITASDLEKLYLILKFVYRQTRKKSEEKWENSFWGLYDEVQRHMMETYGGRLFLDT